MHTQDYVALEDQYGAHNYQPLDVVIADAQGCWVTDIEGRHFLDCLAAYSALNQGHCHPAILSAFTEQARRVTLTSRAFRNEKLPLLEKALHDLTGYDMCLPMNSGAEAVETAIKMARKWGLTTKGVPDGKAEIIVAAGNFHGRTTTIVSFSTEDQYRHGFGPFTPGFVVVPYGDADAVKRAITPNTVAFLIEPIQGEAGIVIPPEGYLKRSQEYCRAANVLFICDEIQSGLGRSGKLFAFEYDAVTPDAVIVGKALGGGFYPISAVLARKDVLGVFHPGDHGSTFGGNPLASATAIAALKVITDEHLVQRSATHGAYFLDKLRAINAPIITEVRGRGLWIGIVLDRPARPYCEALMHEGILCKETHETVIRVAPPLIITNEEIDWAVERFQRVLSGAPAPTVAKGGMAV